MVTDHKVCSYFSKEGSDILLLMLETAGEELLRWTLEYTTRGKEALCGG